MNKRAILENTTEVREAYNIYITRSEADMLRKLGDRNMEAGIRRLLYTYHLISEIVKQVGYTNTQ